MAIKSRDDLLRSIETNIHGFGFDRACTDKVYEATFDILDRYGFKWFRRSSPYIPDFDDLLSETMLKSFSKRHQFTGSNKWQFLFWVLRVAGTALRKELGRLERQRCSAAIAAIPNVSTEPPPYQRINREENRQVRGVALKTALAMLADGSGPVLTDKYINSRSINELSEIHKVPANTLKTRLRRGRDRLWYVLNSKPFRDIDWFQLD